MIVFQYDLERFDLDTVGLMFDTISANLDKFSETTGEAILAIPNSCTLSKMDIYELEVIRDMIDKMIKTEKKNEKNIHN